MSVLVYTAPPGATQNVTALDVNGEYHALIPMPADIALDVAPRVVWRDDGTGTATTWADVMAQIGTAPNTEIYVDQSGVLLQIPPGAYNMRQAYFNAPEVNYPGVNVQDGAVLDDLQGVRGGVILIVNPTTGPALTFTNPPPATGVQAFYIEKSAQVSNLGTVPAVELAAGGPLFAMLLIMRDLGVVQGGAVWFNLTGGFTLGVVVTGNELGAMPISPNTISGDAASLLAVLQDGTWGATWPTFAGFAGSFINVARANDGGAGPTAFRPAGFFAPILLGVRYYNTDTGTQEYWNGVSWVPISASLTIVGSGTAIVPALGSIIVGPFPCAPGAGLVAAVFAFVGGGQQYGENGSTAPGVAVHYRWLNNADPANTRSLVFACTDVVPRTVDYQILQVGP